MKYSKSWNVESELASDPWHSWLLTSALSGLEYNLIFWEDRIEVEFYDLERAEEFALEFGL
jgi:hypothetical protein